MNPSVVFCLHYVTINFQNNNKLKLRLIRRQTVCHLLFTSCERLGAVRKGLGFKIISQSCLAWRHAVCCHLFTSRDRLGI